MDGKPIERFGDGSTARDYTWVSLSLRGPFFAEATKGRLGLVGVQIAHLPGPYR